MNENPFSWQEPEPVPDIWLIALKRGFQCCVLLFFLSLAWVGWIMLPG